MASGRNGWADIIGESTDELPHAAERTDPNVPPPDFAAEPTIDQRPPRPALDTDDPVLAAMAELDGIGAIPDDALLEANPTAKTPAPVSPRLPMPSSPGTPAPVGFDAADTADGYALDQDRLRQAFEAEPTHQEVSASFWRTYRWVVVASAVGVAAFAGAIAYTTTRDAEPVYVKPQLVPQVPPVTAPPPPAKEEARPQPKIVKKAAEVSATPMLTILTKPTGGTVEVNGVPMGKAPVIKPAPKDARLLEVVVELDGYRRYVKQIAPSEAGHFTLTAKLEEKKKR